MSDLEFTYGGYWEGYTHQSTQNSDLVQRVKVDIGNGLICGFTISMHEEQNDLSYFQLEDVTPDAFALSFLEYCLEYGEVLPGGIYRIYYIS